MKPTVVAITNAGLGTVFYAIAYVYFDLGRPLAAWIYVATASIWMLSAGIWVWMAKQGGGGS